MSNLSSTIRRVVRGAKRGWSALGGSRSDAIAVPLAAATVGAGARFVRSRIDAAAQPSGPKRRGNRFASAVARLGRKNRKYRRRTGKGLRGRVRSRGGRRVRQRLKSMLTAPQFFNKTHGDVFLLPASDSTGFKRWFITFNNARPSTKDVSLPYGHMDPTFMLNIANVFKPGAQQNCKFQVDSWKVRHQLTNQFSADVKVKAYRCRARHDVPHLDVFITNIQAIIGRGFATNQWDKSNANEFNTALLDPKVSIYQSKDFTQMFNIVSTDTRILKPGETMYKSLSHGPYSVNPNRLITMDVGKTWLTGTKLQEWIQGEEFWLFEVSVQSVGVAVGGATIGHQSFRLSMMTTVSWTAKYSDDESSQIVEFPAQGVFMPDGTAGVRLMMQPAAGSQAESNAG